MSGLSLTRKSCQSLHITTSDGQLIKVTINEVVGQQVKLNIQADESVLILREELVNLEGVTLSNSRSI
jgi:carbon storage regulator CsrA